MILRRAATRHAPANDSAETVTKRINTHAQGAAANVALSLSLLAALVYVIHATYLSAQWDYLGFTFAPYGPLQILVAGALIAPAAAAAPRSIDDASAVVFFFLLTLVHVPTVIITLALRPDAVTSYGPALLALTTAMTMLALAARFAPPGETVQMAMPGRNAVRMMELSWALALVVLLAEHGSAMRFVALDDVYDQRFRGAAGSLWLGYLHTYFTNVFSPFLLALGVVERRPLHAAAGVLGFTVMYAINAQKFVALTPLLMVLFAKLSSRPQRPLRLASAVFGLCALLALALASSDSSATDAAFGRTLVLHRLLGVPAVAFSQYLDFFSEAGFTYWSHVKVISSFVSPPESLAADPFWPKLGLIVGERVYNSIDMNNANANLFAGDGAAAAGALGIVAVGAATAVWIAALKAATSRAHPQLAIVCMVPMAVTLTNCHFFTTLVSFGGLFWPVFFGLQANRDAATVSTSESVAR